MLRFYTIVIILYCDADTIANVIAIYTLTKELSIMPLKIGWNKVW